MKSVVVMCIAWVGLAVIVFAPRLAAAQSLGTVSTNLNNPLPSCPEARGFATQHDIGVSMTCYNATLTGCAGDDDLDFIFGIANAGGLGGTIVMFDGGNGQHAAQTPDFLTYVRDYVNAGYQVVQIAWGAGTSGSSGAPWEETAINQGSTNTSYSIRKAACRPSTFLNWVRNGNSGTGNGIWGGHGGMCAHGRSAGSGALAYALAWYNAGAASASNGQGYLDKVVLEDGPVFSDIERGCEIFGDGANAYNNQTTIICQNSTQAGCQGWTIPQDPPGGTLEYMGVDQSLIENFTGNPSPSCANNTTHTDPAQNQAWAQMSIVDFTSQQQPSFSYSNTAMSAWLCETYSPGVIPNNGPTQGQLFYFQFSSTSQAGNSLSVNGMMNCQTAEGVGSATPPSYTSKSTGHDAIVQDMTSTTFLQGTGRCKSNH